MSQIVPKNKKRRIECQCRCGKSFPPNRIKSVPVYAALDPFGQKVRIAKTFLVGDICVEPFQKELALSFRLKDVIEAHAQAGIIHRLRASREVLSLQHAINLRREGYKSARQIAIRSTMIFVLPKSIGAYLEKWWLRNQ